MVQEIITYIIIFLAFAYTIYKLIKLVLPSKKEVNNSCSSGCSGCAISSNKKSVNFYNV